MRRWRVALAIEGGLFALCLLYCLAAPNEYESRSEVSLRAEPATTLKLGAEAPASASAAPIALETVAGVLRSDQLAWRVIVRLRLYEAKGFCSSFARRFPGFRLESPTPEAQTWLLERFARRLRVQAVPRTMLIEVRFRSGDAGLSAAVVKALIEAYREQESEAEIRPRRKRRSGWSSS